MRPSDISPSTRDALDRLILDSFELEATTSAIGMSLAGLDIHAFPKSIMLNVLVKLQDRLDAARRELDIVTVEVTNSTASLSMDPVEHQGSHDRSVARSKRNRTPASKDEAPSTTSKSQRKAKCFAAV